MFGGQSTLFVKYVFKLCLFLCDDDLMEQDKCVRGL